MESLDGKRLEEKSAEMLQKNHMPSKITYMNKIEFDGKQN